MVSIFRFLLNTFRPKGIIQVQRMPPAKALRAHLLGLTIGFVLVASDIILNVETEGLSWLISVAILLWFGLVTYYSGLWFGVSVVLLFISTTIMGGSLASASRFYFTGYIFGIVLAMVYNDLVYLYLIVFDKKHIKIAFAYDTGKAVNIIKSPIPQEEEAFETLIRRNPKIEKRKLYRYNIQMPPKYPYTIAIVANPMILKHGGKKGIPGDYEIDPIIKDGDLFLLAVDKALLSFERDKVLGDPAIWSRVRIVTVFDERLPNLIESGEATGVNYGLIQEFQEKLYSSSDDPIDNNLLDPMRQMTYNFQRMLTDHAAKLNINDVDVLFGISASPTHDRATAHFSDWIEDEEEELDTLPVIPGLPVGLTIPYEFNIDPCDNKNKNDEGKTADPPNIISPNQNSADGFKKVHDYWARIPGRVAINILGARNKTFMHEFAHAMSSAYHGCVLDEYTDFFVLNEPIDQVKNLQPLFSINRIDRNREKMATDVPIPVHKVFAKYNCTTYHSDLSHPSMEEDWCGYFPGCLSETIPCTMDRTYGFHQFDQLISAFMYERLMVKLRRKERPAITSLEIHEAI